MLNQKNKTGSGSGSDKIITISKVSQYEMFNAIYDSKVLAQKLTPTTKLVLLGIARHYNPAKQDCFPSYSCICAHLGVSKKSVERAIKELVSAGFITYRTEKVNRYRFTGHFFASVNLSVDVRQIDADDMRQFDAQTNKEEKIKKKGSSFKNSSEKSEQGFENQETLEKNSTCGTNEEEKEKDSIPQAMYVDLKSRAVSKKEKEVIANRKETAKTKQPPKLPGDGGGSRVPSVAETQEYLKQAREARKYACHPREYGREAAKHWYSLLTDAMKTTSTARFLYAKYNGWA